MVSRGFFIRSSTSGSINSISHSGARGKIAASFGSGQGFFQPQNNAVEKAELAGHPRQAIDEHQPAHEQKQSAAEEFDGVQMFSEALVKTQELPDPQRGQKERNGQPRGVHREEQNAARDGITGGGQRQHGGQNRSDARGPAKGERKAQQEAAPDAGLRAAGAQTDVAVEPARHRRAKETDQREREEMDGAQAGEKRSAAEQRHRAKDRQQRAENEAGAHRELYQYSKQVQAEEKDERAGDGSKQRAILAQESAYGAGGGAEGNEYDGKSHDKGQRGSEKPRARRLPLAQLFHADAREHGDVSGNQREHARRKKGNEAGEKSSQK